MFLTWLIVFMCLELVAIYYIAAYSDYYSRGDHLFFITVCTCAWPVAIPGLIIAIPFVGVYYLGDRVRKSKEKK